MSAPALPPAIHHETRLGAPKPSAHGSVASCCRLPTNDDANIDACSTVLTPPSATRHAPSSGAIAPSWSRIVARPTRAAARRRLQREVLQHDALARIALTEVGASASCSGTYCMS